MYQNGPQNATEEHKRFERAVSRIISHVGEEWLESSITHPLHQVWHRKDWLASTELVILGESLETAHRINARWSAKTVTRLKADSPNNCSGAVFEIIAAAACHNPPIQTVLPPVVDNPGYDLEIRLRNEKTFYLSLKNYSQSRRALEIAQNAAEVESLAIRALRANNQVISMKVGNYPGEDDWGILKGEISSIVSKEPGCWALGDNWVVFLKDLCPTSGSFHPREYSYTFLLFSPFHQNERKNLLDKLHDGCINLGKHGPSESQVSRNAIMVQIPPEIAMEVCEAWNRVYLDGHPSASISAVIFYQPAVVVNKFEDSSHLALAYRVVARNGFTQWLEKTPLSLQFPLGIAQRHPTRHILKLGEDRDIDICTCYIYQFRHHYYYIEDEGKLHLSGVMGIHIHGVARLNGSEMEIELIAPSKYELALI